MQRNLRICVHCLYTLYGIALSPGHFAFLLVAEIAENSSKLSDFEEKGTFKLGDQGIPSSGCKGTSQNLSSTEADLTCLMSTFQQ